MLDPKKFLELVKRLEQEKDKREQYFEKEDDVYRETFLNENVTFFKNNKPKEIVLSLVNIS